MDSSGKGRRSFIGKTLAGGAAIATGLSTGYRAEARTDEPLRIGCLNVVSYSHLDGIWGPVINAREGEKDTPFTNMRITHCWDINFEDASRFAKEYGCEAVRNFDDMLGKVDGIVNGGYYNHPWNHILHEPYLEAGLPNLINRPFSNSLEKARTMLDLAKKSDATVLCPSAHELNEAITRAKEWARDKLILAYSATNSFDDYPSHGVHGLYMVCKAVAEAGFPVESVSYEADSWHAPPGVLTFRHRGQDGRTFYGSLHQVQGSWATINIHTPEEYGGENFLVRYGRQYPFDTSQVWAPTIWTYQKMAMYGDMPQTFEQIYLKTRVFLAGWRSFLLNEGKPVLVEDVPPEWESPVELPNHPDHDTAALFRKKFG